MFFSLTHELQAEVFKFAYALHNYSVLCLDQKESGQGTEDLSLYAHRFSASFPSTLVISVIHGLGILFRLPTTLREDSLYHGGVTGLIFPEGKKKVGNQSKHLKVNFGK